MKPDEFLKNLEFIHDCFTLDCNDKSCDKCEHNLSKKTGNQYCIYKYVGWGWGFDPFVGRRKGNTSITIDEYAVVVKELAETGTCGKYFDGSCDKCPCQIKNKKLKTTQCLIIALRWWKTQVVKND